MTRDREFSKRILHSDENNRRNEETCGHNVGFGHLTSAILQKRSSVTSESRYREECHYNLQGQDRTSKSNEETQTSHRRQRTLKEAIAAHLFVAKKLDNGDNQRYERSKPNGIAGSDRTRILGNKQNGESSEELLPDISHEPLKENVALLNNTNRCQINLVDYDSDSSDALVKAIDGLDCIATADDGDQNEISKIEFVSGSNSRRKSENTGGSEITFLDEETVDKDGWEDRAYNSACFKKFERQSGRNYNNVGISNVSQLENKGRFSLPNRINDCPTKVSKKTGDDKWKFRSEREFSPEFYKEYNLYMNWDGTNKNEYFQLSERQQDLYDMSKKYSLAHCVAEDLGMRRGIAVRFRQRFENVDKLLNQRQKPGGMAFLQQDTSYIYYLITKKLSSGKPTYKTMFSSLLKMKKHIVSSGVKKLAIPKLGCGLDKLEWSQVRSMIIYLFKDLDMEIVVCSYLGEFDTQAIYNSSKVIHVKSSLEEMRKKSIIIYLCSEDGYITEEMRRLHDSFSFLPNFCKAPKLLGNVVSFDIDQDYRLYGCTVKITVSSLIDYTALQSCMNIIEYDDTSYNYKYIGFEAVEDDDDCVNHKIVNILSNTVKDKVIFVSWPSRLQEHMPSYARTSL